MAYVAISASFLNEVKDAVFKMRDAELEKLNQPSRELKRDIKDPEMDKIIWGEYLHLKAQLPDNWKASADRIDVITKFQVNDKERDAELSIRAISGKFETPCTDHNSYYSFNVKVPQDHPLMADLVKAKIAYYEVYDRWGKVKEQVTTFLRSCKSLNEAVKLWPDVALYVPQSFKDRMAVKPARQATDSTALDVLASIDTDSAVAAAVTARFMASSGG